MRIDADDDARLAFKTREQHRDEVLLATAFDISTSARAMMLYFAVRHAEDSLTPRR